MRGADLEQEQFFEDYVVGADGGRSPVRESVGLAFEGATAPNQWIVIDVENDPVATPNVYLVCDPKRPYVSAALPHGVRRFEFMVMKDESGTKRPVSERTNVLRRSFGVSRSCGRARTITEYSSPRSTKVEISVSPNINSSVRPISDTETPISAARARSIFKRTFG